MGSAQMRTRGRPLRLPPWRPRKGAGRSRPMAESHDGNGSRLGRIVAGAQKGPTQAAAPASEVELLCFRIQDQLYALPTACVRTIVAPERITDLPLAPAHVRGVVSLLGRIVAILDLAVLEGREPTQAARRMILVESSGLAAAIPVSQVSGI